MTLVAIPDVLSIENTELRQILHALKTNVEDLGGVTQSSTSISFGATSKQDVFIWKNTGLTSASLAANSTLAQTIAEHNKTVTDLKSLFDSQTQIKEATNTLVNKVNELMDAIKNTRVS